jgi:hypothetical protein
MAALPGKTVRVKEPETYGSVSTTIFWVVFLFGRYNGIRGNTTFP